LLFDPYFSDTTEWEKVIKKEDINKEDTTKNANMGMAEDDGEIVKIHVFAETAPLRGDTMLLLLQHRLMQQLSFCVCLSMSGASSNQSRKNYRIWNALSNFQNGSPGYFATANPCCIHHCP